MICGVGLGLGVWIYCGLGCWFVAVVVLLVC